MIIYVEESLHEVGGHLVKFDSGYDFHWYKDDPIKGPRWHQVGAELKAWLEKNKAVTKAEAQKKLDAEIEAIREGLEEKSKARAKEKERREADEYEALLKRLTKDLKK